jgi:predicted acylesterase/phospholipase RssA
VSAGSSALRLALLAAAAVWVAGCMQTRVQKSAEQACPIKLVDLSTDPIGTMPGRTEAEPASPMFRLDPADGQDDRNPTLGEEIAAVASAYRAQNSSTVFSKANGKKANVNARFLVLSGGGKWGSFGAGFLHGLYKGSGWNDGPKDFAVVTGISTGALQAPFMFVANEKIATDPAMKRYTAAADTMLTDKEQAELANRTYLDDLPLAYRISRSETVLTLYAKSVAKLGLFDGITAGRKGSIADLKGLRTRLATLVDDGMMTAIANRADRVHRLYVGMVDFDSGKPVAVDMGDLADKWQAATGPSRNQIKGCFHDVLVASSSEPLMARPVFIREQNRKRGPEMPPLQTRMYMDGGIRHGVFLREVMNGTSADSDIETTVIVNGTLQSEDRTGDQGWMARWNLLGVLRRAQAQVTDQLYQSAVERVAGFAAPRGALRIKTARGYESHPYAAAAGEPGTGSKRCDAWQTAERDLGFPPMFMRCLISFGKAQATTGGVPQWDVERRPDPSGSLASSPPSQR